MDTGRQSRCINATVESRSSGKTGMPFVAPTGRSKRGRASGNDRTFLHNEKELTKHLDKVWPSRPKHFPVPPRLRAERHRTGQYWTKIDMVKAMEEFMIPIDLEVVVFCPEIFDCAVPWWKDSISGGKNLEGPHEVGLKMQELRLLLADILDRPTMRHPGLAHECYYSKSDVGSVLPRHMDERHEELKGTKGWLLPSRRSISWLVYLSDEGWDLDANGGALRSFPQAKIANTPQTGTHDGNLQIGWLVESNDGSIPVYLDSWFPVETPTHGTEPQSILYALDSNKNRVFLTRPWSNDAIVGMSVSDFIRDCSRRDAQSRSGKEQQLFLTAQHANLFALIEDRTSWDGGGLPEGSSHVDTSPERASLVMFDSVMVPHEVRRIEKGTRIALAGWFHEQTQPFPEELYS